MARNINIFGVKFAYPRGLRKSPRANSRATCVGRKMAGASGKRADIKAKFAAAAKECAHVAEVSEAEPAEIRPELESETDPTEAKLGHEPTPALPEPVAE